MSDEEVPLTIMYDSTYCVDKNSRVENQRLEIAYKEHPQKVNDMYISYYTLI